MSFDVNIGRSEPVIKAASGTNNDGGSGGNLGYMMGGGRQKKKDQGSLFSKNKDDKDSFELSSKIPKNGINESKSENSWLNKLIKKII